MQRITGVSLQCFLYYSRNIFEEVQKSISGAHYAIPSEKTNNIAASGGGADRGINERWELRHIARYKTRIPLHTHALTHTSDVLKKSGQIRPHSKQLRLGLIRLG